jgi:heme exporter protein B
VNRAPGLLAAAWIVARKDLAIEVRTRSSFVSAAVFAIVSLATFYFAWPERAIVTPLADGQSATVWLRAAHVAPGVVWVIFVFSGLLAVQRSFTIEDTDRAIDGLMLAPIDRESVYLGKLLSNILFIGAIQLIAVPVAAIFYDLAFDAALGTLLGMVLVATVGLASVATLFGAIAINTRIADILLPLLSLPFFFPVVLPGARVTADIFSGGTLADSRQEVQLLVAFDIVFLVVCTLLYPYSIEE